MIYRVVPTFRMKLAAIMLMWEGMNLYDLALIGKYRTLYGDGSPCMNAQLDRIGSYLYGPELWALYAAGYEVNTSLKS